MSRIRLWNELEDYVHLLRPRELECGSTLHRVGLHLLDSNGSITTGRLTIFLAFSHCLREHCDRQRHKLSCLHDIHRVVGTFHGRVSFCTRVCSYLYLIFLYVFY